MMNYFELFNIPLQFNPDKQLLKKQFLQLSKQYHPDRLGADGNSDASQEKYAQINAGYKVLSNELSTIKHILQLHSMIEDDEKYNLPADFLMEMLELSESAQFAETKQDQENVQQTIQQINNELFNEVAEIFNQENQKSISEEALLRVKEYYFKKKYLERILEGMR